jgi:hypothetical protein
MPTTRSTWTTVRAPGSDDIHVIPDNDQTAHTYDDCICGPVTEPVPRDDGTMGWLIVHESLDRRELLE